MRKYLMFIFLLWAGSVSAQMVVPPFLFNWWKNQPPKSVPIPSAPELTTPITITYAGTTTGNITTTVMDGEIHAYLDGPWDRLVANGLVGTQGNEFVLVPFDADVRLGDAGGAFPSSGCVGSLNGSTFVRFIGRAPPVPLVLEGNNNGAQWLSLAAGSSVEFSNVVAKDIGFAGVLINTSDAAANYDLVTLSFYRVFGLATEGEAIYTGGTNPADFSVLDRTPFTHIYGTNKGRDGLQMNNHLDAEITNVTMFDVGKEDAANQNHLYQNQNCNGYLRNFIFHGAPRMGSVFTHGFVHENGYFRADAGIFQGRLATSYSGLRQAANRMPVLYVRVDFDSDEAIATLFTVLEDQADVICYQCNFGSNIAAFATDSRVDQTTHLLLNVEPTFDAVIPEPTYTNHDPDAYTSHGLLTAPYHLSKGRGYRTDAGRAPPLFASTISAVVAITDISVAVGTAFEDIPRGSGADELPEVVRVTLAAGFNMTLPVTWDEGDYDGDTPDTYSITGAISLPYYLTNPGVLEADLDIIVEAAAFDPSDIASWDTGLNKSTASADLGEVPAGWDQSYSAADGDALTGPTALPTWDGTQNGVRFTRASSQSLLVIAGGSYAAPLDIIVKFRTPASFTGTQTVFGLSNTHRMDYTSAGALSMSGTSLSTTLSVSTDYIVYIHLDGASSTYQINSGTETSVSLSTGGIGTPTYRIGSTFADGNYFDGWIYYLFIHDTGFAAGEKDNMVTWLTAN